MTFFFLHHPGTARDDAEEVQEEAWGCKVAGVAGEEPQPRGERDSGDICQFVLQCLEDVEFFSDPISSK